MLKRLLTNIILIKRLNNVNTVNIIFSTNSNRFKSIRGSNLKRINASGIYVDFGFYTLNRKTSDYLSELLTKGKQFLLKNKKYYTDKDLDTPSILIEDAMSRTNEENLYINNGYVSLMCRKQTPLLVRLKMIRKYRLTHTFNFKMFDNVPQKNVGRVISADSKHIIWFDKIVSIINDLVVKVVGLDSTATLCSGEIMLIQLFQFREIKIIDLDYDINETLVDDNTLSDDEKTEKKTKKTKNIKTKNKKEDGSHHVLKPSVISYFSKSICDTDYQNFMNAKNDTNHKRNTNIFCGLITEADLIGGYQIHICSKCYARLANVLKKTINECDIKVREHGIVPNYTTRNLRRLVRCRLDYNYVYGGSVPLSSFANSLAFYLFWMHSLFSVDVTSMISMTQHCDGIARRLYKGLTLLSARYIDDIYRKMFQAIENEVIIETSAITEVALNASLLIGISTLGGPRTPIKEDILTSIQKWVSKKDFLMTQFEKDKIEEWLNRWHIRAPNDYQPFEVFSTDLNRWATSGGAPSVEFTPFQGKQVRSKWAWGIQSLIESSDVYHKAKQLPNVAHVALKEESKTRTVITTPMASYLRQSYILHRLGKANFLHSTIGNTENMRKLRGSYQGEYICLDASKFDHCISLEFMNFFWNVLLNIFRRSGEETIVNLILDEITDLNNLYVEYDSMSIKYEGGLLSGWRITTLIGSLKSALLCEYILSKTSRELSYVVQGDDIIIMGDLGLSLKQLSELASHLGLEVNDRKSTRGDVGEFLKYRYSNQGIYGMPCRAIRSIFYANPWLDSTVKRSPNEIITPWHVFLSRTMTMLNYIPDVSKFYGDACVDLSNWTGKQLKVKQVAELLQTPINVGGLGLYEFSNCEDHINIVVSRRDDNLGGERWFLNQYGISENSTNDKKFTIKRYSKVLDFADVFKRVEKFKDYSPIIDDRKYNLFKTCLEIMLRKVKVDWIDRMFNNCLGLSDSRIFDNQYLPRHLRYNGDWKQLFTYYQMKEHYAAPTSAFFFNSNEGAAKKMYNNIYSSTLNMSKQKSEGFNIGLIDYINRLWSTSALIISSM